MSFIAHLRKVVAQELAATAEEYTEQLTLQKSRMLQMQGVKGEAVVIYAEPLTRLRSLSYGGPSNAGLSAELLRKAGDAVSSAFPKGEQLGKYHIFAGLHHVCVCPRRSINP